MIIEEEVIVGCRLYAYYTPFFKPFVLYNSSCHLTVESQETKGLQCPLFCVGMHLTHSLTLYLSLALTHT
jgi:hypothetical protein